MTSIRPLAILALGLAATAAPRAAWALAWSEIIAQPGIAWQAPPHVAADVAAFANDPLRRHGSQDFFSELPNDAVSFDYVVRDQRDARRLVARFATIGQRPIRIVLSPARGTTKNLLRQRPAGMPVEFVFGDQKRLDQWFEQLPGGRVDPNGITVKEFGAREIAGPPTALPPTLVIHAGHPAIDVATLDIPPHVEVEGRISQPDRDDETLRDVIAAIERVVEHHGTATHRAPER